MHIIRENARFLTMSVILWVCVTLMAVSGLTAPAGAATARKSATFAGACRVVVPEADLDTSGKLDRIIKAHGPIHYSGSQHGGRWTIIRTGKVFGYSAQEDSTIVNSARCVKLVRPYR